MPAIQVEILALPESLTTIGEEALAYIWMGKEMYVPCMVPPACGKNAFAESLPEGVVYVPEGTLSLYQQAPVWKTLGNIKEMKLDEMRAAISTGIPAVMIGEESPIYFNLRGQRVNSPTRGVYISKGKKEIIK